MGMTCTQKILAHAAGLESVTAGRLIEAECDVILGNDITAPVAVKQLEKYGGLKPKYPDRIALVLDHFVPNKDIAAAAQCSVVRGFAKQYGIKNFFDVGEMGIEHALLPEKGLVLPGNCIIGADSHTCTYGALGAFSTGVGSTDIAYAMATGKLWFKVPSALRINLTGRKKGKYVTGKDLILHLIGKIGVEGASYKSLEFCGEGVRLLSMDDRFTVCNMAIEAGAKNGIFPVDEKTREYLKGRTDSDFKEYTADDDAVYEKTVDINLESLGEMVAYPHLPSNVRTVEQFKKDKIAIDQVVIGSCTNGRISDMRAAAEILRGRKKNKNVRLIIIPATQEIYRRCIKEGLIEVFLDAGAAVSTPTCGPCLGGYMGVLDNGERCVSTTNRNFVGRMGHTGSEVYLASPYVAAASAVAGVICSPRELTGEE